MNSLRLKMFSTPLVIESIEDLDVLGENESGESEQEIQEDEYHTTFHDEIKECFHTFDEWRTGKFKTKYLDKALKSIGLHLSPREMEEALEYMDVGGVVEFDQFKSFVIQKTMELNPLEALKEAFQTFDPEDDGVIPSDRLKKWLTTLGNPLTEKEAKELIKLGDPSKKGFVAYEDLVPVLVLGYL